MTARKAGTRRRRVTKMDAKGTREHIVRAADELFYKQGFEHTSFADVADAVGISRGNFYYHFKTKDEILAAVIGARIAERRRMLGQWEAEQGTPAGRIRCYISIVITNETDIESYGCPVGSLTTELSKLGHPSLDRPAGHGVLLYLRGDRPAHENTGQPTVYAPVGLPVAGPRPHLARLPCRGGRRPCPGRRPAELNPPHRGHSCLAVDVGPGVGP
jgi:AcrR family transcriptional regulator